MTHDQHKAFARLFGPLVVHSGVGGIEGHPEVIEIHADANSKRVAGEDWHSDLTCDEAPPMGSILYMPVIPQTGGDTLFASMYAAYDALSDRMKSYLDGLSAVHDGNQLYSWVFPDIDKKYPCSTHPIVRVHPVTGRKALFVNRTYTARIVGLPKIESDAILDFLFAHCTDPNFQVRFKWQPHSVAFWDNRCTQHFAVWDYFPQTRSGYRVTIAGDKPF